MRWIPSANEINSRQFYQCSNDSLNIDKISLNFRLLWVGPPCQRSLISAEWQASRSQENLRTAAAVSDVAVSVDLGKCGEHLSHPPLVGGDGATCSFGRNCATSRPAPEENHRCPFPAHRSSQPIRISAPSLPCLASGEGKTLVGQHCHGRSSRAEHGQYSLRCGGCSDIECVEAAQ